MKLVKDENVTKDLLGALVHYLAEDDHAKIMTKGHSLLVKVELERNSDGMQFEIKGIVGNDDYRVISFRFYDAKTEIKKGEVTKQMQENDWNNEPATQ